MQASGQPSGQPSAERVRRTYDAAVAAALPAVTGALSLLFVLLAVLHPFFLEGRTAVVLTAFAVVSALGMAVLAVWTSRDRLPRSWAHPVAVGSAWLAAAHALAQMALTHEPEQTSYVMLVVVAAGAWVLAPRWLALALAGLWTAWLCCLLLLPNPALRFWGFAMAVATLLAVVINLARRQSLGRLERAATAAERASVEDPLTGLLNRRGLTLLGDQVVATARRSGNAVHCTFIDVRGIASVNARGGLAAGDRVLVAVADALKGAVRAGDVVARWSGAQFCVLGPGPGIAPVDLERRLRGRLSEYPPADVAGWAGELSSGTAMLAPWDDGDLATLLEGGDRELRRRRALIPPAEVPNADRPSGAE